MSLFEEIAKRTLLNELDASRDKDIKDAINNVRRVRIGYDDEKGGKGKNTRYILPVAFGKTKNGKKAVRAYQTMGSSKRGLGNPPNSENEKKWKLFLTDRIYSWDTGNRSFKDYGNILKNLGLNQEPNGDSAMVDIYAITPFANPNVKINASTTDIPVGRVTKQEVEPTQTPKEKEKEPTPTKTARFEPEKEKTSPKTLDKTDTEDDFKNKVEAPPSEPITKQSIVSPQEPTDIEDEHGEENGEMYSKTDGPIAKKDIVNPDEPEENELTSSFKDMMNRMEKAERGEEENNEDEEEK